MLPQTGAVGAVTAVIKVGIAGLFVLTVIVAIAGQQLVLGPLPAGIRDAVVGVVGGELDIVLGLGVFLGVGVYLTSYGFALSWQWLRVRGSDARPVADVDAAQPVEIEGTAQPLDGSVTAPLTGVNCLAYETVLDRYTRGSEGGSWGTADTEADGVPFSVEDGTGRLRVEPDGAEFFFEVADGETVSSPSEPSAAFADAVAECEGVSLEELNRNQRRLRLREYRLDPGEPVYVSGVTTASDGAGLRIAAPTDARGLLQRALRAPFLIADTSEPDLETQLRDGSLGLLLLGLLFIGVTVPFYVVVL